MKMDCVLLQVGNELYIMELNFRFRKLVCNVADRQTDRQTGCLDTESERVAGPVGGY